MGIRIGHGSTGKILNPIPGLISLTQAAQICTPKISGTDLGSLIRMARILFRVRGTYLFTLSCPPDSTFLDWDTA